MRLIDLRPTWTQQVAVSGVSRRALALAVFLEGLIGQEFRKEDLADLMGMTERNVTKLFEELLGAGVLAKGGKEDLLVTTVDTEGVDEFPKDLFGSPKTLRDSKRREEEEKKKENIRLRRAADAVLRDELRDLTAFYGRIYGLSEHGSDITPRHPKAELVRSTGLLRALRRKHSVEVLQQALSIAPADPWLQKTFQAHGNVPPLPVLLSGRVMGMLLERLGVAA